MKSIFKIGASGCHDLNMPDARSNSSDLGLSRQMPDLASGNLANELLDNALDLANRCCWAARPDAPRAARQSGDDVSPLTVGDTTDGRERPTLSISPFRVICVRPERRSRARCNAGHQT